MRRSSTGKKDTPLPGTKDSRYYSKNKVILREKARQRMAEYRERQKSQRRQVDSPETEPSSRSRSPLAPNWDEMAVEDETNRLTPISPLSYFEAASKNIYDWLGEWGGLDAWPEYLDGGYDVAAARGDVAVDAWVRSALDHADRGRLLANLLGQMETALPLEMWKIRELWRRQTILVGLVTKGLAMIELRVDIVRKGPFNLIR